jgi:S-adenosylmethionine:tRNA ribosyltransferase-isomerase
MERDREDYQTMFAKVEGAIAAPTAGLHFTSGLIRALELRGIQVVTLTLHVGIGTFRPVTTPTVEEHRMEPEWFDIPERTRKAIQQVRASVGRVVAVGTTVARSLETAIGPSGELCAQQSHTNLFITPGFQFRVVDVLFTNFHLPETTLVMLVAAFAGRDQARSAYEHAVKTRYRFYSYGDAMLIQ